jgi:cell wall-associated NlpC family hydrolase
MVHASDFVGLLLRQDGDRYEFGHRVSLTDPDPDYFDCSEIVEWGCARLKVKPKMPDGSWLQARHCRKHGLLRKPSEAVKIQGALLFKFSSDPFSGDRPGTAHVAVSLGNGSTIEARGRKWGVGQFTSKGRKWTHAALIPGMDYREPTTKPDDPIPAWKRNITQPPMMRGEDVRTWQKKMKARGWTIGVDSKYGEKSEKVCRQFQDEKNLRVTGIVDKETWRTTWTAPVTP